MKKLLIPLYLILLIGFSSFGYAGTNKVVNIDGEDILFPPISSLVSIPTEMLEVLNGIQQTPDEMSFAYITSEDLEIWNTGEFEPNFAQFVQIRTRPNNGKGVPYSQFLEQVNSNKKEFIEIENTLNETNAALVKQDEYISNLSQVEMSNIIDTFIPYPAFIDNLDTFAATLLAVQKKTVNGVETRNARIITTIVIYTNDRILNVNFYSNLSENFSIASQEEKAKVWLEDFWKANESSSQSESSQAELTDGIKAYQDDDFKKAMKLLKPLAEGGNDVAQFYVGKLYYHGDDDIIESYKDAFYWFEKSIEKDNLEAYVHLGTLYKEGKGVLRNPKKAFEYFKIGANSENKYQDYAQLFLGEFYIEGLVTKKNLKQAAYWINKAYNNPLAKENEIARAEKLWEEHELWKYE
tara:strand:- start:1608 stop:2834 length:1227 start_codon:yes stop_codon:yes gene_type:complete